MPDAVLVAVAKAVAKELETASLGRTFTVERSYADWDEELPGLSELRLDVVPVPTVGHEQFTRGLWRYVVQVNLVLRKRLTIAEQDAPTGKLLAAEVDSLVELLQRIGEYFAPIQPGQSGRRLADLPEAVWLPADGDARGFEMPAAYVREHLREMRQYTGVVRLTYAVPREADE